MAHPRRSRSVHGSLKRELLDARKGRGYLRAVGRTPTPSAAPKSRQWLQTAYAIAALLIFGTAAAVIAPGLIHAGTPVRTPLPAHWEKLTAADLAAMTDAQLARLDPLVMNLIVARGIPGLESLDIAKYASTVDEWASLIEEANRRAEPSSRSDPAYRVSREFWMAGGMAVALAGPAFGIRYTTQGLDPGRPEQQFIHGVIDGRQGTCASMPVLYMAIGHRLGWPIKAVVSGDHMWARWDGAGRRFNLEATNAKSDGSWGSFSSLTDEECAQWLKTPREAIDSGSDFTSLTPRQALGVFLQSRAAYWAVQDRLADATRDAQLATKCFPQNRDICQLLAEVTGQRRLAHAAARCARGSPPAPDPSALVERINRENRERLERKLRPPPPIDPLSRPEFIPGVQS
jgi:transglutaminase superfamily protein